MGLDILVIPDVQAKAGVDLSHLDWIGRFIVDKRPDVLVCIGDFADMPSLSSYDKGKRSFEGRTYQSDIQSARDAMHKLLGPIQALNLRLKKLKKPTYNPRMVLTLGNHEDRISRAVEDDARLFGTISLEDLQYEQFGWEVYPFLEVVNLYGVAFSHYFTSGVMGKPVNSARSLVKTRHMSAVMGHVQTTDIYMGDTRADGKSITGLFVGVCYLHDEKYLGAQGNHCRRQIVMLHDVEDGQFDPAFISLSYLKRKYGS